MLKKALIGGLAALTFGLSIAETSAPAMALGLRGGAYRGGGFHGGYYRGGRGYGWGAAGLVGGLALGAAAAGAYGYGYGYPGYYGAGCIRQRPVYDAYGYFRGYQPIQVC
jgi:hypothetical protein